MGPIGGLVPITRAFLSSYYDKYPFPPLSPDVDRLASDLRRWAGDLAAEAPLSPHEEHLISEADSELSLKLDENMWKNREHIEEILFLLEESHWPKLLQQQATSEDVELAGALQKLKVELQSTFKTLEYFQLKNADSVFNTIMTYMPQDFRGSLIRKQRERSEKNRQAEVEALVNSGGSIHDRYALLWKQQTERRKQLAQLGSAAGVYKAVVKYLVGVPQVLLDFVRKINDDEGPMVEQRHRYGPLLRSLTKMVLSIRLFLFLSWERFEARKLQKEQVAAVEQAVNVYGSELKLFLTFMSEVFSNSPFLISAEDAGAAESRKSTDYKEIVIPVGETFEVSLTVDSVNSYIAWDFSLVPGKVSLDIGFSMQYVSPQGETTMILPYKRYDSDQGNFCTILAGSYKLIWDNSYSTFFKKSLRYKVDAIPPVEEITQPAAKADAVPPVEEITLPVVKADD